jgi:hypothetical protein
MKIIRGFITWDVIVCYSFHNNAWDYQLVCKGDVAGQQGVTKS